MGDEFLRITDVGDGWPALADLVVDGETVPVALFVAPVGLSHRNRDDRERRFQNPGGDRPIIDTRPARDLLLLGLWEADELIDVTTPLLVSADPIKRLGLTSRYSVFVSTVTLETALAEGWSYQSVQGELIRCFVPPLLERIYREDRGNEPPRASSTQPMRPASGLPAGTAPNVPATPNHLDVELAAPPPGLTSGEASPEEIQAAIDAIASLARPNSSGPAQGRGLSGPQRRAVELPAPWR